MAKNADVDREFDLDEEYYRVLCNINGEDRPAPRCSDPEKDGYYDDGESRQIDDRILLMIIGVSGGNEKTETIYANIDINNEIDLKLAELLVNKRSL